jgi:hypothetical protein
VPVRAEVGEAGAGVGEQVPADGEDGVADGDQGAFLAAALDDPLVAGGQEGAGPGGTGGGFADGAAEPGVALAGGGGFAAAGTPSTSRSKNLAAQIPPSKINTEALRYRLTNTLLRWCLYDGHCRPLLRLRDGTHPLAAGPVNPGLFPGQADQTGSAGGCQKNLGPADKSFRRTTRPASAESEVRPGPRPPTLRRRQVETREAGPEALSTSSLPSMRWRPRASFCWWGHRTPSSGAVCCALS